LSFDLTIDGDLILTDPGSYVYTPAIEIRAHYRCAGAHAAPLTKSHGESVRSYSGPFSPPNHPVGECISFNENAFIGQTTVDGGRVIRTFEFCPAKIEIIDEYYLKSGYVPAQGGGLIPVFPQPISREYGWREQFQS
jgi:hypothetical protein